MKLLRAAAAAMLVLLLFSCAAGRFTGDSDGYAYRYTEERDRAWEEDILCLARGFLEYEPLAGMSGYAASGHPLLIDRETPVATDDGMTHGENLYDAKARRAFIREIDALLSRIPELSDERILLECQRITAALHDAHSFVDIPYARLLPMELAHFSTDEGEELRAVALPEEYEGLLLARLTAVNGVSAEELISRLGSYVSAEEHSAYTIAAFLTGTASGLLLSPTGLSAAGAAEEEDTAAAVTFQTDGGESVTVTLPYLTDGERAEAAWARGDAALRETLAYRYPGNMYWWDLLDGERTLYVRCRAFSDRSGFSLGEMSSAFSARLDEWDGARIVIDLRGNSGGMTAAFPSERFRFLAKDARVADVYVLIDGESASASVKFASWLRRASEKVRIAGTCAAQPPRFLSGDMQVMPHSGVLFLRSLWMSDYWPGYDKPLLTPDVEIRQTKPDTENGTDTVLEAVLHG